MERAEEALKMRRSGHSCRAIGDAIGVSHTQVKKYLAEYVSGLQERLRELAEECMMMEIERLDELTLATHERAIQGNDDAIRNELRVMSRRAKLLGLDAPTKTEAKVEQSFDEDAYREKMQLTMSSPEAREALHAYNEALRRAKEAADNNGQ